MKRLGVFLLLPTQDLDGTIAGLPPALNLSVLIYRWKKTIVQVKCLLKYTVYNDPGQGSNPQLLDQESSAQNIKPLAIVQQVDRQNCSHVVFKKGLEWHDGILLIWPELCAVSQRLKNDRDLTLKIHTIELARRLKSADYFLTDASILLIKSLLNPFTKNSGQTKSRK